MGTLKNQVKLIKQRKHFFIKPFIESLLRNRKSREAGQGTWGWGGGMNPGAAWGLVSCTRVPSTATAMPAHGDTRGSLSCHTGRSIKPASGSQPHLLSHSSLSNLRVCPDPTSHLDTESPLALGGRVWPGFPPVGLLAAPMPDHLLPPGTCP